MGSELKDLKHTGSCYIGEQDKVQIQMLTYWKPMEDLTYTGNVLSLQTLPRGPGFSLLRSQTLQSQNRYLAKLTHSEGSLGTPSMKSADFSFSFL